MYIYLKLKEDEKDYLKAILDALYDIARDEASKEETRGSLIIDRIRGKITVEENY